MALARYQPSYIDEPSYRVSFWRIMLRSHRTALLSLPMTYKNPDLLNMAVAEITYRTPSTPSDISSTFEISIESRREEIGGDLGWEAAIGASAIPGAVEASGDLL